MEGSAEDFLAIVVASPRAPVMHPDRSAQRRSLRSFAAQSGSIREPQQHVTMTPQRCTPANQMTPAQAVELRHETRLPTEPALVFLNYVGARAILADHERIAPHARPANVDRIRHRPFELLLVEHLRR